MPGIDTLRANIKVLCSTGEFFRDDFYPRDSAIMNYRGLKVRVFTGTTDG